MQTRLRKPFRRTGRRRPRRPSPPFVFENVKYSYDEEEGGEFAVNGVSLTIAEGEFVAVLGRERQRQIHARQAHQRPSAPHRGESHRGSGWTPPTPKRRSTSARARAWSFRTPTTRRSPPSWEDDVAFGPENIGLPREEIGRRIEYALDAVGMTQFRSATPSRLSGGQKQRIAIAGVLAIQPKIMILDESTAMLDPKGRREVMDVVKKLNREQGMTVILITHFMEEALEAGARDRHAPRRDRHGRYARGDLCPRGRIGDIQPDAAARGVYLQTAAGGGHAA